MASRANLGKSYQTPSGFSHTLPPVTETQAFPPTGGGEGITLGPVEHLVVNGKP